MANKIAKGALKSYLKMKNPGYAILLDAPWGAGKTHFVKEVCFEDVNENAVRYVSLNGVSDDLAFRRALLKDSLEASLAKRGAIFGDFLSRKLKLGDLGSLARDFLEERLIASLPMTLIFDDIERCSIEPQQLLGLINDFVEHKDKRVILLVHSEEHDRKDAFLKRKEKLIGRTLKIEADLDVALPSFLAAMDDSRGRKYLHEHKKLISSVFEQSGHQNLRLLRNALRDCSLVLDRIEEELFLAKEPTARFVSTFLALSMALAKGEITTQALDRRDSWKIAVSGEVEEDLRGLNELFKRHEGADIYAHSGSVLSKALCELLFVKGHAETEALNDLLKSTRQFDPQDENPLWKRIVHWGDFAWDELEELVAQGEDYLFEASPVEAGPYLHIADGLLRIESYGGLQTSRKELVAKILQRIEFLAGSGGLPTAEMGRRLGWGKRGNHFSFGGYGCDANADFLEIMNAMSAAQLSIYEGEKGEQAKKLAECFGSDLSSFLLAISYAQDDTTFYRVPIFHEIDVDGFSQSCLEYLENGQGNALGQVFEKLVERHNNNEEWQPEIKWFCLLRAKLEEGAIHHSNLARAQLELFFRYHWKFASPEKDKAG
nr:P-loop NTPase fold protein [uncultured Celeribacter sp.]